MISASKIGHSTPVNSDTDESVVDFSLSNREDLEFYANTWTISKKSKQWQILKPRHGNSLYSGIINRDLFNLENYVEEFIHDSNENEFRNNIHRLILDLAGYQDCELPQFNDAGNLSWNRTLINWHRTRVGSFQKVLPYAFQCSTKLSAAICIRALTFFENVVKYILTYPRSSWELRLLDVVKALKEMSLNALFSVRHTSTALAIKMLSGVLIVCQRQEVEADQTFIKRCRTLLFEVFESNCLAEFKQLREMRVQCIAECEIWIEALPNYYFPRCIKAVRLGIVDEYHLIRLKSLNIVDDLMKIDTLKPFVKEKLEDLMKYVVGRLMDVKDEVRLAAASVCTTVLLEYNYNFSRLDKNRLKSMIFEKDALVSAEGFEFYWNDLWISNAQDAIVTFNHFLDEVKNDPKYLPLFVEAALLKTVTLFSNLEFMFKLLQEESLSNKDIFVSVVLQCAVQLASGKSSVERTQSRSECIEYVSKIDVYRIVISKLPGIIDAYSSNVICVKAIQEFLLLLDGNTFPNPLQMKIWNILEKLRCIYLNTTDPLLLEILSEILFINIDISEKLESINSNSTTNFKIVLVNCFKQQCKQFNHMDTTPHKWIEMNNVYKQLTCVFRNIDLHHYLSWQILFDNVSCISEDCPKELSKNIYLCLTWYLTWKLRNRKQIELYSTSKTQLQEECNILLRRFFESMMSEHENFKIAILDSFCEFLLNFSKEKCNYEKYSGQKSYYIDIKFSESQEQFIYEFVRKMVFLSDTVPLITRQKLLMSYMKILLVNVFNNMYLFKMFKYYHEFNSICGKIFCKTFTVMKDDRKTILVFGSIKDLYEETVKSAEVSQHSGKYKNLQQLAEDLTKLLHEKYYQDLLKMVVNYAEGHCDYKFLKVFDYAVNNLPNKDCMPFASTALKLFKEKTHFVEEVRIFMEKLNNHYATLPVKKRKIAK